MRLPGWRLLLVVGTMLAPSAAAQTVMTSNFIVDAPTRELAKQIGDRAEAQRTHVATMLFGGSLPAVERRTMIRASLADSDCTARTMPAPQGQGHLVSLRGPVAEINGPTLDHEIVHTTIADVLGRKFPAWLNEGLASRYDNSKLRAIRRRELHDMLVENTWPDLRKLMSEPIRTQKKYAVAESIVDYLLLRCEPVELIELGQLAERDGIDAALRAVMQVHNVEQLEREWRRDLYRVAANSQ